VLVFTTHIEYSKQISYPEINQSINRLFRSGELVEYESI
jgi:hypothetical protein